MVMKPAFENYMRIFFSTVFQWGSIVSNMNKVRIINMEQSKLKV